MGFVQKFGGNGKESLNGLNKYIYEKVIPICFSIPKYEDFDFEDAISLYLFKDVVKFFKLVYNKYDNEFLQVFGQYLLNLKMKQDDVNGFLILLKGDNIKLFEENLIKFLK